MNSQSFPLTPHGENSLFHPSGRSLSHGHSWTFPHCLLWAPSQNWILNIAETTPVALRKHGTINTQQLHTTPCSLEGIYRTKHLSVFSMIQFPHMTLRGLLLRSWSLQGRGLHSASFTIPSFSSAFCNQVSDMINICWLAITSLVERCLIWLLQQAKMIKYDLVFHCVLHKC